MISFVLIMRTEATWKDEENNKKKTTTKDRIVFNLRLNALFPHSTQHTHTHTTKDTRMFERTAPTWFKNLNETTSNFVEPTNSKATVCTYLLNKRTYLKIHASPYLPHSIWFEEDEEKKNTHFFLRTHLRVIYNAAELNLSPWFI